MNRKQFIRKLIKLIIAKIISMIGLVLYSFYIERHWLHEKKSPLLSPGCNAHLAG